MDYGSGCECLGRIWIRNLTCGSVHAYSHRVRIRPFRGEKKTVSGSKQNNDMDSDPNRALLLNNDFYLVGNGPGFFL